jgi:hypothetical protein
MRGSLRSSDIAAGIACNDRATVAVANPPEDVIAKVVFSAVKTDSKVARTVYRDGTAAPE